MISAVVCSRSSTAFELVRRNLLRTAATAIEVIRIDNEHAGLGICEAYNRGVSQAQGDIIVFLHEDVFHLEIGWGPNLMQKFMGDASLGVVGVAGTQALFADPPLWSWAGRPWLFGKVVHELDAGERFFMTVFSPDSGDRDVVALDGCWLAVRKQVFAHASFDSQAFPGFHFYDIDLCMQARKRWRIVATTDILVKHQSPGSFNDAWQEYAKAFRAKWKAELPAFAPGLPTTPTRGSDYFNVDLKGRVPQATIT